VHLRPARDCRLGRADHKSRIGDRAALALPRPQMARLWQLPV
jgi:hypothetical protein